MSGAPSRRRGKFYIAHARRHHGPAAATVGAAAAAAAAADAHAGASLHAEVAAAATAPAPQAGGDPRLSLAHYALPPCVVEAYAAAGVGALYPWQAEALYHANAAPLHGGSLVFSAPTSAGKSIVAEVLFLRRLMGARSVPQVCVLVLPFVSLVNEKARWLQRVWAGCDLTIRAFYNNRGGSTLDRVDVAVCTPERASGLVNKLIAAGRVRELGVICVDELHLLGDPSRGPVLEAMLMKTRLAAPTTQLVGMSATLPNAAEIAGWLGATLFEGRSGERPVPLHEAIVLRGVEYSKEGPLQPRRVFAAAAAAAAPKDASAAERGGRVGPGAGGKPLALIVGIAAVEHIVAAAAGAGSSRVDARPSAVPAPPATGVGQKRHAGAAAPAAQKPFLADYNGVLDALVCESAAAGHPVLVFCTTKKDCERTASALARCMARNASCRAIAAARSTERTAVLAELKHSPHGLDAALHETVPEGVAFHHAGLTTEERDIVESAYRRGALSVLTATSTLGAGVNLPARRVIFNGLTVYGPGLQLATPIRPAPPVATAASLVVVVPGQFTAAESVAVIACGSEAAPLPPPAEPGAQFAPANQGAVPVRRTAPAAHAAGPAQPTHRVITSMLDVARYRQMSGRAGRSGHGDHGEVYVLLPSLTSEASGAPAFRTLRLVDGRAVDDPLPAALDAVARALLLASAADGDAAAAPDLYSHLEVAAHIMTAPLPALRSALGDVPGLRKASDAASVARGDARSEIQRALLELVCSGLVDCDGDDVMRTVAQSTLLHHQAVTVEQPGVVTALFQDALGHLLRSGFVRVQSQATSRPGGSGGDDALTGGAAAAAAPAAATRRRLIAPTQLGLAAFAAGWGPEEALAVYDELAAARNGGLSLDDDGLHALYLVCSEKAMAENFISPPATWMRAERADGGGPVNRLAAVVPLNLTKLCEVSNWTGRGATAAAAAERVKLVRLFGATLLHELVCEVPLPVVAEKNEAASRGALQKLQLAVSTRAGQCVKFCRELRWFELAAVLAVTTDRLDFGVKPELLPLMVLPRMTPARARRLYAHGMRDPAAIAAAGVDAVADALPSRSWEPDAGAASGAAGIVGGGQLARTRLQAAALVAAAARVERASEEDGDAW